MKKSRDMTAAELLAELRADREWVKEQERRDLILSKRADAYREAETPLVEDLNRVGVAVRSVWDLVNTRSAYPEGVPVLLKHLMKPYPERVREGIARALAVSEAQAGWPILLKAFRQEADTTTTGVKWALALALGRTATDDVLDDVIPLLRDKSLGENRVPLIQILCRSHDPRSLELLNELKNDINIGKDVKLALRTLRPRSALTSKAERAPSNNHQE